MDNIINKIYIGNDHAVYIKENNTEYNVIEIVKSIITDKKIAFEHIGCYKNESVNFNDYAMRVANKVYNNLHSIGIVVCGTGLGITNTANSCYPNVVATRCIDTFDAKNAREHNGSRILGLRAREFGNIKELKEKYTSIISTFLETNISMEEKYVNRRKDTEKIKKRSH